MLGSRRSVILAPLAFALLLVVAGTGHAQNTIHVPADRPTIQAGIDAAQDGDTVLVAPGTYYENLQIQAKSITLRSDKGAAQTIVDGGKKDVVARLYASLGFNIILDGFTLQNGATPAYSPSDGGIIAYGNATIQNNTIRANWGYGINVQGGSASILNNHIVITAPNAGQTYCYVYALDGINMTSSSLPGQIAPMQSRISGNLIEGDGTVCSGAGIGVAAASPVLIENNTVRGTTKGIGVSDVQRTDDSLHVLVRQNLIYNNRYGGLYFDYFSFLGSTPYGVAPATMVATNNTFYNNLTAGTYYDNTGGGPLAEVVLSDFDARMALYNNLIIGNSSVSPVVNCAPSGGFSVDRTPPVFDHNDVYNLQASSSPLFLNACEYTAPFIGIDGNISANPLFKSSTDLHLSPSSPSVDAGDNSAPGIAGSDFDANARVQDAKGLGHPVVDIGAYEITGSQALPVSTLSLTASTYYQIRSVPPTLTAILRSPSGPVSAPVTFLQNDVPLPSVTSDATGTATLTLPVLPAGIYRFTATYAGSSSLSPATSTVIYVRVAASQSDLVLTASPNPAPYKQSVTLTTKVTSPSSPASPPSGIVAFMEGATILSNQTLAAATGNTAVATFSTSTLTPGVHSITATFHPSGGGDGDSQTVQVSVIGNSTCGSVVSSRNPATSGQSITFTGTVVTGCGGLVPPTGSVYFSDGTTLLGTAPLAATGTTASAASFSTTSLALGTHTITAAFLLNQNLQTITASLSQVVIAPTVTAIKASPNPAFSGNNVSITASVTSPSGTPAGTVTILDGAVALASLALDAQGNASLNTTALAIGTHSLTAAYAGEATHAPSTSAALSETIQPPDFTLTLTNPQTTIQTQHHTTTSVTLSSVGGFADTVSLTCGTLPQYVTCSFTPSAPALASGGTVAISLALETDSVPGYAMVPDSARPGAAALAVLLCPVGLLSLFGLRRRVRPGVRLLSVTLALVCLMGVVSGCGHKDTATNVPPSAAPGVYVVPVTATGTTTGIAHTAQLTLTITP